MGYGGMMSGAAGPGMPLRGVDMSLLSVIAAPDPEAQRKYDAMGLPDPIAFAALTALGAIPNPMAMLNKMMLAAQERIEKDALAEKARQAQAVPPGKSFVEAFQDLQRSRDTRSAQPAGASIEAGKLHEQMERQAKEASEQARHLADRMKDAEPGGWVTLPRDMATVFSAGADDDGVEEPLAKRPVGTTLSSMLTGREGSGLQAFASAQVQDKIYISKLPDGVTEGAVKLECARHGAVTSVILEADGSGAYVAFASADMAAIAARRMSGRPGLLGSTEVGVRLISEVPENVRLAAVALVPTQFEEDVNIADLPEYLKPREERKKKRSRSRRRSRSRSAKRRSRSTRRRKRKSRSAPRWLDRSRSNSHTATGQYIRATGCSSTVKWWEKKRQASSSSSGSSGSLKRRRTDGDGESNRPRQVAVKGHWAQFVLSGKTYYYDVLTQRTTWEKPEDFGSGSSRRSSEAAAAGRLTSMLI